MNWLLEHSDFLVAACTLVLAVVAFVAILCTNHWNKRHEKTTLEWNKRNEQMRVLPFLEFYGGKYFTDHKFPRGCISGFELSAKNIGVGPILSHIIHATQGDCQFHSEIKGTKVMRKGLGLAEEERVIFKRREIPVDPCTVNSIQILVVMLTVLGGVAKIHYTIKDPLKTSALPEFDKLEIDGREIRLGKVLTCTVRARLG